MWGFTTIINQCPVGTNAGWEFNSVDQLPVKPAHAASTSPVLAIEPRIFIIQLRILFGFTEKTSASSWHLLPESMSMWNFLEFPLISLVRVYGEGKLARVREKLNEWR
jgi:hypothetical protein